MEEIEFSIRKWRRKLDRWLTVAYKGVKDPEYFGETDLCFSGWHNIEIFLGLVFDKQLLKFLSKDCQESILFFISRSDEGGRIIAWLHPVHPQFSHCGVLTKDDFLFLCQKSLELPEDYSDWQLASCFRKLNYLTFEDEKILLRFFNRKDSNTRMAALDSLVHLDFTDIEELFKELWASDDCEVTKLNCLGTLKELPKSRELFEKYLAEFETIYVTGNDKYLPARMAWLKS